MCRMTSKNKTIWALNSQLLFPCTTDRNIFMGERRRNISIYNDISKRYRKAELTPMPEQKILHVCYEHFLLKQVVSDLFAGRQSTADQTACHAGSGLQKQGEKNRPGAVYPGRAGKAPFACCLREVPVRFQAVTR